MFLQCHMSNVLLKARARTSVNLLCQTHLINGINPSLNSKCYFSWVGAESSNVKAELEINHEEKLESFSTSEQQF